VIWAAFVALAVGTAAVHDARAERETTEAEAARLVIAGAELTTALPVITAAVEQHRALTGGYPARFGRLDWEALGYGPGRPGPFGPEVAEFTGDATPGASPLAFLPHRVGLRWVLDVVRGGGPQAAGNDFVYLEYAEPERVTIIVLPMSVRARVFLGEAGLLLQDGEVSTPGLAELAVALETVAADHGALALEELGAELRRLFLAYHAGTGAYPVPDRNGIMDWRSLYDKTGASPESMEGWARRTWDLRFVAVISPLTVHPYLPYLYSGSVRYYGQRDERDDVFHEAVFAAESFSFVFVPHDGPLRAAMSRRAGADMPGLGLIVTPEELSYGRPPR
jgi:hypothetical protein